MTLLDLTMLALLSTILIMESILCSQIPEINPLSRPSEPLDVKSIYDRDASKWQQQFQETLLKSPSDAAEIYHLFTKGSMYSYIKPENIHQMESSLLYAINKIMDNPITAHKMMKQKTPFLRLYKLSRGSVKLQTVLRPIADSTKIQHWRHRQHTEWQAPITSLLSELLRIKQLQREIHDNIAKPDNTTDDNVQHAIISCNAFLQRLVEHQLSNMELQSVIIIFGLIMDIQVLYEVIYKKYFPDIIAEMVEKIVNITAYNFNLAVKAYQIISRTFPDFTDNFKDLRMLLLLNKKLGMEFAKPELFISHLMRQMDNDDYNPRANKKGTNHLIERAQELLNNAGKDKKSLFEYEMYCSLLRVTLEASTSFMISRNKIVKLIQSGVRFMDPSDFFNIRDIIENTHPECIYDYLHVIQDVSIAV